MRPRPLIGRLPRWSRGTIQMKMALVFAAAVLPYSAVIAAASEPAVEDSITVTELPAGGDEGVAARPRPNFQARFGRIGTRICIFTEGDTTVFDIACENGIDKAIIKRASDAWPKTILVRLHLGGLESFQAGGKDVAVEWSVSSTRQHAPRTSLVSGKRVTAITKDSPYYRELRIVGGEGKIPLKDGYFEVPLPEKLFECNPREITLKWIDFYRN